MRTRILLLAVVGVTLAAAAPARAEELFAVDDDNQLHRFSSDAPGSGTAINITGLQTGEAIVGIDLRPQTGALYGVGNTGGTGRLYVINTVTGAATQVGPTTTLSGTSFGVDFNPVVDRLRVVSDADQNLRINPDNGIVTMDAPLQYAMGDPNEGMNPNVVASGYTNNFFGATTTTLYAIDTGLNTVVMQNPPNNGTLTTIAPLDMPASTLSGFDILDSNEGYATTTGAGSSTVLFVDPLTGKTRFLRTVGDVLVGGVTGEPTGAAGPFSGLLGRGPGPNELDFTVRNDGQRPIEFLAGQIASGFVPVSADIVLGPDANCFLNQMQRAFSCGPFAGPGYWGPGQGLVIRVGTDPRYPDNGGVQMFVCAVPCSPFFRDAGPFAFGGPAVVTPPDGGTPDGGTPDGGLPGDFDLNGRVDAADYVVWRKATLNQDGLTVTLRTPNGVRIGSQTALYNEWRANFGNVAGSRNAQPAQRRKAIRFARNRTTLRGKDSKRVRIRLTKAGRRAVRGYTRKRLRATLTLRVTYRPAVGAAAQTRTFKQKVTLRVKRKRR